MISNENDNILSTTNENTNKIIKDVNADDASINKLTEKIENLEITNGHNEFNINDKKETEINEDLLKSSAKKTENINHNKGKMKEDEEISNINNKENSSISELKNKESNTESQSKLHNKEENIYKLKVIEKINEYQGIIQQKNIITQNINGPCPLLALCNILILRGDISLPLKKKEITYEEIIDELGDYIARNTSDNSNSDECSIQELLDIIPTLKKGLDINVKFDSVQSFEPSPALTVFKFFNIKLVHGWTVDPEDKEAYRIIVDECGGNYNALVEKIIESDSANASKDNINEESQEEKSKRENLYHKAMVCKNFIESNASQLTYHGLTSIPDVLEVGEPTAFFRNNHFLTLIKTPDNNMYTLVTDQGFVNEKKIVWESLSTLDGDSIFVDGLFNKYNERSNNNNDLALNSPNEDLDYALALSLQQDEEIRRDEMIRKNANRRSSNKNIHHQNSSNRNKRNSYSSSNNNNNRNNNRNNNTNNYSNKNTNTDKSKPKDNEDDKCILM